MAKRHARKTKRTKTNQHKQDQSFTRTHVYWKALAEQLRSRGLGIRNVIQNGLCRSIADQLTGDERAADRIYREISDQVLDYKHHAEDPSLWGRYASCKDSLVAAKLYGACKAFRTSLVIWSLIPTRHGAGMQLGKDVVFSTEGQPKGCSLHLAFDPENRSWASVRKVTDLVATQPGGPAKHDRSVECDDFVQSYICLDDERHEEARHEEIKAMSSQEIHNGLKEQLRFVGLGIRDVVCDRNTFFRGIADQLCGDEHQHSSFLQKAIEWKQSYSVDCFKAQLEFAMPSPLKSLGLPQGQIIELYTAANSTGCRIRIHNYMHLDLPMGYLKSDRIIHLAAYPTHNAVRFASKLDDLQSKHQAAPFNTDIFTCEQSINQRKYVLRFRNRDVQQNNDSEFSKTTKNQNNDEEVKTSDKKYPKESEETGFDIEMLERLKKLKAERHNKPRQTQQQLNDANRQNEAMSKERNVVKLLQKKQASKIQGLADSNSDGTGRDMTDEVLAPLRGQNTSNTNGTTTTTTTTAKPKKQNNKTRNQKRDQNHKKQEKRHKKRQKSTTATMTSTTPTATKHEHENERVSDSISDKLGRLNTIDALKQELKKNQTTIQRLSAEKEKSQTYAEAKQNALDAVQTKRDALESEYDALKREMLQVHATHKKQMKSMHTKHEQAVNKAAVLKDTVDSKQAVMDVIRAERDAIVLERAALQQAVLKLQSSKSNEATLLDQIDHLKKEIEELQPLKIYADDEDLSAIDHQRLITMERKLQEKLKRINDAKQNMAICIVCQDAERNHVFVPCGHVCICGDCSKKYYEGADAACPVCRVKVTHVMRMFHA